MARLSGEMRISPAMRSCWLAAKPSSAASRRSSTFSWLSEVSVTLVSPSRTQCRVLDQKSTPSCRVTRKKYPCRRCACSRTQPSRCVLPAPRWPWIAMPIGLAEPRSMAAMPDRTVRAALPCIPSTWYAECCHTSSGVGAQSNVTLPSASNGSTGHRPSIASRCLNSPPIRTAASRSRALSDDWSVSGMRMTSGCRTNCLSAASTAAAGTPASLSRRSARLTHPPGSRTRLR